MEKMKRYAVYYAPAAGDFATRANAWLGWDAERGQACPHPDLGLDAAALTGEPRKYGFHGTIRAPFRPAEGVGRAEIEACLKDLAARLAPVHLAGLRLVDLKGFLALIPEGDMTALLHLGAEVVTATNPLRAPLNEAEIAKRRPESLSPRKRALLALWGYPGVMEEFRFHLTLTDSLPEDQRAAVADVLHDYFTPVLPKPFVIDELCLFGEDGTGRFHLLHRYALQG